MLTTPTPVPPNSTSPLPSDWGQQQAASLWNLYSAGLTVQPNTPCAPGPEAFADLAPAGVMFPYTTPAVTSDALDATGNVVTSPQPQRAYLGPAPVSPMASQVYQVQASQRQSLTSNNKSLAMAVDGAGQSGAGGDDWGDAAELHPMGTTENIVTERTPVHQRQARRGPPRNTNSPASTWGGGPMRVAGGGCQPGLSVWAKLFLLAGGAAVLYMLSEQ